VDNSPLKPRLSARPFPVPAAGSAEAPARGRPARPIRFTPSRIEPVAPRPVEHTVPADQPSIAARGFVWLLVAAGWAVFVAWWVIVLQRESLRSFGLALGLLGATLATSTVGMMLWTRYNIHIARNGKRGKSSLYIPMLFEHDTLGRPLELPAQDLARTAPEVRVVLRGGVKAYIAVEAGEL
jgi:hypothetical protein